MVYSFFFVLSLTYSQDVAKNVANYAKRCASVQRFAFLGHKTNTLFTLSFSLKTTILGPDFNGTYKNQHVGMYTSGKYKYLQLKCHYKLLQP